MGKHPPFPKANEQLNWEDSTIELPNDPDDGVKAMLELLQDDDRLRAIHYHNYWNVLHRHQHRQRLATILRELDLRIPAGLQEQLNRRRSIFMFGNTGIDVISTISA